MIALKRFLVFVLLLALFLTGCRAQAPEQTEFFAMDTLMNLKLWGDPDGITQVCYNLLDNAAKFAAPGTAIAVSITTKGSKAYISIKDQGETIPPEELPLVFDRFHKTDHSRSEDREGVGLGLYIVKHIVEAHGGSIQARNDHGLVFEIALPCAEVE